MEICRVPLIAVLIFSIHGCTPQDSTAAPSAVPPSSVGSQSSADRVSIVREERYEFPSEYLEGMRHALNLCIESRLILYKDLGKPYDAKSEVMSDEEILNLTTQRTEEYFDGNKHAVIKTGRIIDNDDYGSAPGKSCRMKSVPFKTVDIQQGKNRMLIVEYDFKQNTGNRQILKLPSTNTSPDQPDQHGATRKIAGHECRWNAEVASHLVTPTCTLTPNPIHAGTGVEMVAILKSSGTQTNAAMLLPGTKLSLRSMAKVDEATSIKVGETIPAEKFEFPEDSMAFPLTTVN